MNGFTSGDVITQELPALDQHEPEFVTLLIGVNDVVQGVPEGQYAANVGASWRRSSSACHQTGSCAWRRRTTRRPHREPPSVTRMRSRERIERVNATLRSVCEDHEIAFVVAPHAISLEAADDPRLVADDGLHPSGEQYRRWTDAIVPVIEDLLRD